MCSDKPKISIVFTYNSFRRYALLLKIPEAFHVTTFKTMITIKHVINITTLFSHWLIVYSYSITVFTSPSPRTATANRRQFGLTAECKCTTVIDKQCFGTNYFTLLSSECSFLHTCKLLIVEYSIIRRKEIYIIYI